ncbi:serine O-acetyltransferase [Mobilicoccus pelagius]|uniref:Serine acetyltransferase n=1 Tax=Mobilicoccus pelagius NBRC 104925 TaxID=1089455 RepID=H5UMR4_9MICO|nr:serine acetyltransferase [Mobilicoccus pelagius]GAB47022.1 serine acetyltransferase [Mobilicoccus pelagius NBRC 104925]
MIRRRAPRPSTGTDSDPTTRLRLDDPGRQGWTLAEGRAHYRELVASDLPRNPYLPWRTTIRVLRAGQVLYRCKGPVAFVLRRIVSVADSVWTRGLMGSEIPTMVWFGPALRLPHAGRGLMIHSTCRIGDGVTIYHHVSLGVRDGRPGPTIGDDVEIGAGAAVLGPIRVGDGGKVGANAVVTKDTEPGRTYVGIPARPLGS